MAAITVGETRDALPPGTALLGGAGGLGRPVTGTATFRARMPAFPTLHGGEVALVPMALVRQVDPTAQVARLVAQLAAAGIAAVVLLGAVRSDGLEAAARAAETQGLPLFSVPEGSTAEEVELALHRHLAGQRETLLRRSQELQQEFTQLALAGRGIGEIVERLAGVTGQPAAWQSPASLEPLAWAQPPGGWTAPPELSPTGQSGAAGDASVVAILRGARLPLQRWIASLTRTEETGDEVASIPLRADEAGGASPWRRLVVPVHAAGGRNNGAGGAGGATDVAGYLSLICTDLARGGETRLALSAAALAASIEVLRARTAWEAQGSAVASLVHDWLGGRLGPGELGTRSMQLGLAFAAPYAVVVIDSDRAVSEGEIAALAGGLLGNGGGATTGAAGTQTQAFLSAALGDGRTALVAPIPTEATLDTAAARLHAMLADRNQAMASVRNGKSEEAEGWIYAGIGRAAALAEDVPRAYGEALQSLAVARRLGGRHRVAYFGTLGVYRVLAATSPGELEGFRRETLGGLLSADDRSGGELLRTLETYLLCGGSPQETALRLHTHRNTVLYRLQRIGEALGVDVRAPEAQFTLWLALRAGDVLGSASPSAAGTPTAPPALSGAARAPIPLSPPKQAIA